jgi:hypothetical protein
MDNLKKRPLVKFRRPAILYALLLVFALIFTQALRATASAVLFWFLVLLPILSVLYVLIGKALIRIYVSSDITKVEKLQPVNAYMNGVLHDRLGFTDEDMEELKGTLVGDHNNLLYDECARIAVERMEQFR